MEQANRPKSRGVGRGRRGSEKGGEGMKEGEGKANCKIKVSGEGEHTDESRQNAKKRKGAGEKKNGTSQE